MCVSGVGRLVPETGFDTCYVTQTSFSAQVLIPTAKPFHPNTKTVITNKVPPTKCLGHDRGRARLRDCDRLLTNTDALLNMAKVTQDTHALLLLA